MYNVHLFDKLLAVNVRNNVPNNAWQVHVEILKVHVIM